MIGESEFLVSQFLVLLALKRTKIARYRYNIHV